VSKRRSNCRSWRSTGFTSIMTVKLTVSPVVPEASRISR
jgi:hypothetical protein